MKSLLSVIDIKDEVDKILELANDFKEGKIKDKPLEGKSLAMIFQKSSTRTRTSFEIGMYQLGGQALFLTNNDLQLGRGEPIQDTAKVISRYADGIMIRALKHEDVVEFSQEATIPIINGLTDLEHPCQALADMLTVYQHLGSYDGKFTYIGDGNNVCNSLMLICACLGMDFTVACPTGYQPNEKIIEEALKISEKTGSNIIITQDVQSAAKDSDVIYTDVWVSMGDEEETEKRQHDFKEYQVNSELIKLAKEDSIFMHCLPAIRGEEVTSEVIDGPHSVIYDQAENRLHAQKAVMCYFMKN